MAGKADMVYRRKDEQGREVAVLMRHWKRPPAFYTRAERRKQKARSSKK